MPINKYYTSVGESKDELEVFHNIDNQCTFIMRNQELSHYCVLEFTSDELTDLINELINIKKQIESNELH